MNIRIEELKEQLSRGTFYYCCYGALIKVPVKEIIEDFKWCYLIQNEEHECIGYIAEIEE